MAPKIGTLNVQPHRYTTVTATNTVTSTAPAFISSDSASLQPPRGEKPDFREGSILSELDKHGRVVGYFRCGKMLGRGGFAKCYEVHQDGMEYALKVVDRTLLLKNKTLQKLHSEISIHKRMKHNHIVEFIRTFQDDWNVYILLEKCSNQTLMEISKRRPRFTVPETQYITLQALSAIQYMHEQCVIHRDLKLGNIMMDANMCVKIGDFGLAAELRYDGERKRTICGTPNYIAPEIIEGAREGHSYEVDVWSLGVVLYTLLVGEPPFQTSDVRATYRRIRQCRYEFPPNVEVPSSAKELIHRILQSRPDQRPTLAEIRAHVFFRIPPPPTTAPATLFYIGSRHHSRTEGQERQQLQEQQPTCHLPLQTVKASANVHVTPGTLQSVDTNTLGSGRYVKSAVQGATALTARGVSSHRGKNGVTSSLAPQTVEAQLFTAADGAATEEVAAAPMRPHQQLDEEEKHHLTALRDQLHNTLLGVGEAAGRESARTPATSQPVATEQETDEESRTPLQVPTMWVTSFADFSAKYGLCYRLNTGHTGVHFNDSTKMVWEPITNRVEYYMRVKEVTSHGNANVVHARDQQHVFHMDSFPESLTKKVTLIKYFKTYLSRGRSSQAGVDVVRCSPYVSRAPALLSDPHMIEDIVYVKRWLITPEAIIFRLSNRTIQVCFHDKAEVILSSESRVVTYTNGAGERVTMALSSVASRSREIASRLQYTKDILCELIQKRDI
ncbi:Protein tyrosine kinase Protein kinase domain [Trypanosoma vivax]|nr:polo-like protein kinase [Trypanosoma vivax]KAH8620652.1 Protein tyrosine kinase Protein kinase domain [Trypanosoma vivax]